MTQNYQLSSQYTLYEGYASIELGHKPGALTEAYETLCFVYQQVIEEAPSLNFVLVSESALLSAEDKELVFKADYRGRFHAYLAKLSTQIRVPIVLCSASAQGEKLVHEIYLIKKDSVESLGYLAAGEVIELPISEKLLLDCAEQTQTELQFAREQARIQHGYWQTQTSHNDIFCATLLGADTDLSSIESRIVTYPSDKKLQLICFDVRPYRFVEVAKLQLKSNVSQLYCYNRGLFGRQIYYHSTRPQHDYKTLAEALIYALREYFDQHALKKYLIGMSGGLDSALVLGLAWAAVGADKLVAISMPGPYSSQESYELARAMCDRLGVFLQLKPIDTLYRCAMEQFELESSSLSEQNLQARLRALILMTESNKTAGSLVLNTTNKSEAAMGYSTLYGDTIGAFSPLCDLFKTEVTQLARVLNELLEFECVPNAIIERPPTAELAPEQSDEQSLGVNYQELDVFLRCYLSDLGEKGSGSLVTSALERRLRNTLHQMSFKRAQEPLGPQLSTLPLHEFDQKFAEFMHLVEL